MRDDKGKDCYGLVYKVTNIQNNKCYIGYTTQNYEKYINNHFKNAFKNKKGRKKVFYNAIKKWGKFNFKCEILGYCYSKEEINECEKECIYFFRSYGSDSIHYDNIYGYNMTKGGDGGNTCGDSSWNKGLTKETDSRVKKQGEELKKNYKKENHPFYNKKRPQFHCENISKGTKGKSKSEQHKTNLSLSLQGYERTKESCIKQSNTTKGKKQPLIKCPYCGKEGGTTMYRWHFEKCKFKENL